MYWGIFSFDEIINTHNLLDMKKVLILTWKPGSQTSQQRRGTSYTMVPFDCSIVAMLVGSGTHSLAILTEQGIYYTNYILYEYNLEMWGSPLQRTLAVICVAWWTHDGLQENPNCVASLLWDLRRYLWKLTTLEKVEVK